MSLAFCGDVNTSAGKHLISVLCFHHKVTRISLRVRYADVPRNVSLLESVPSSMKTSSISVADPEFGSKVECAQSAPKNLGCHAHF